MAKAKQVQEDEQETWEEGGLEDDDEQESEEEKDDSKDDDSKKDEKESESSDKKPAAKSSAKMSADLKTRGVVHACPRCRRIFYKNNWVSDNGSETYAVRTEFAYCTTCLSKEIGHFIGSIEVYDKELKSREKQIINLAKRIESELENRLPFEKIINIIKQNDVMYIFLNSTRLTLEIAREIRKEFHGSVQYEWYERNQYIRSKWFAEADNRDFFRKQMKAAKERRLGLFAFELD